METIQVSDREGNTLRGIVEDRVTVGDADLLQVDIPDTGDGHGSMAISMILYPDGTQWTPWDWTNRVLIPEVIPETRWLRQDKYGPGVMLNGLPRALE
jgi:hypothetical protein